MDIDLLNLEPQRISKNLKGKFMMVYGLPGCGKTTLGSQFPKSLILGCEQGTNALDNVYVQPIQTWGDLKKAATQLTRKKDELMEKFENIIIDTADSAWDLCVKFICSQNGVQNLGDIEWGKGYDFAKKEFSTIFRDLTYAGYGLVFISHSTEKTMKDERGNEYTQINPALPARPYDIINKMVDLIGYIREIELEDGTSKRYIFFRGDKRFFAKSRFKYIEPKVEFSYENVVEAIYNAIDKQAAESGHEATNNENPYVALDFDTLMQEARDVWAQVAAAEKAPQAAELLEKEFGKPTRFSEITADQVDKLNSVLMKIKDIL